VFLVVVIDRRTMGWKRGSRSLLFFRILIRFPRDGSLQRAVWILLFAAGHVDGAAGFCGRDEQEEQRTGRGSSSKTSNKQRVLANIADNKITPEYYCISSKPDDRERPTA